MTTHDKIELPPLPKFDRLSSMHADDVVRLLRSYGRKCARAAIEADRKRKGEVVVTKTPEGEIIAVTRQDDEGHILSVIAEADSKRNAYQCPVCGSTSTQAHLQCLDCDAESVDSELAKHNKNAFVDRKRRGEPVAWIRVAKTWDGESVVVIAKPHQEGAKPVYLAPQPAEPVKVPSMIDLIADDAYAATFQSVGQYRKALLARYATTKDQP